MVGASLLVAFFGEAPQKFKCFSVAHGRPNLPLNLHHGEVKQKCPGMSVTTVITDLSLPNSARATGFTKALSEDLEYLDRSNAIVTATYGDLLISGNEDDLMAKT